MYKDDEIDWSSLQTEHTVYIQVPQVKKLAKGIFVCPECDGEGHIVTVHRTFSPHKYGKCHICEGTGEIQKCTNINCNRPVSSMYVNKLCNTCNEEYIHNLLEGKSSLKKR